MTTTRCRVRHWPDTLHQLEHLLSPIDECIALHLLESQLPHVHSPRTDHKPEPGVLPIYRVRISFAEIVVRYVVIESKFYTIGCKQTSDPAELAACDCVIDDDGSDALVDVTP